MIRILVGHGFPAPPLLSTRDGATSVAWQGRLYETYAWFEGLGFEPGDERQMAGLGHIVGYYHRLATGHQPPHFKLPPWGDVSVSAFLDVGGYVASRWAMLVEAGRVEACETPFFAWGGGAASGADRTGERSGRIGAPGRARRA